MTDEPENLPEDTGKVDLTPLKDGDPDLYQAVDRRIGTMYGVTKELRKTLEQQSKDMRVMFDKLSNMEQKGAESEREQILDGIKSASEEGDHEKVATLTDKLTRLTSTDKGDPGPDTGTPSSPGKEDKQEPDLSEFLSTAEEAALAKWSNEKDSEGKPVRPWLDENHPQYARAMEAVQVVLKDKTLTPTQMMAEIDRIMQPQRPQTPVLTPSAPPRQGKSQQPQITPEQRQVAEMMGVDPKEYMAVVAGSEQYPDGTMVKVLELDD